MGEQINVSTQGISQDWSRADGEYGELERGMMEPEEFADLLQKLMLLEEPDYSGDADLCPPGVYAESAASQVSFYFSEGKLYEVESQAELTPQEALALIAGQAESQEEIAARGKVVAEARAAAARAPVVRRPDVQPTDADLDPTLIDTGPDTPQIAHQVWKSSNWRGLAFAPWALAAFFGFVGLVTLSEKEGIGTVLSMLVIAIVCLLLRRPLKRMSMETFRLGLDWQTNTLWAARGQKLVAWVGDANTITDIEFIGMDVGDAAAGGGKEKNYILLAQRGAERREIIEGATLVTKKEASRIVEQALQLL